MTKTQGWLALAGIFLIASNIADIADNHFTAVATALIAALFTYCAYLEIK